MAKPINLNEESCDPVSSNCVIWQGPDIECIKLCKGDSITTVVHKMAVELCQVMDILDIENYDLTCFNVAGCPPEDFKAFITFLIGRICALENITLSEGNAVAGCPNCIVNIAPCFYFRNPVGDLVTTMQLTDYVTAMGNRICGIVDQINTINLTLTDHESRITELENAPAVVQSFEMVSPKSLLPSTPEVTAG